VPLAIVFAVAAVLAALALLFDGGDASSAPAALRPAPLERIVAAVERERGLRFAHTPEPVQVTPRRARAEGVATLDEDYPPARRRADAEVLVLLGLVPPGTDLGKAAADTFGEAVAGYYDPRSGELRVVQGAQTANRVLYEITLAHELDHALEDQHFDFDTRDLSGAGDRALAYTALVEGSATALMQRYAQHRFGAEELLVGSAASAFAGTGGLPPFLTAQLLFSYTSGETFVNRLLALGQGGWSVVDSALKYRPPASTEQVLHPDKYVAVERPDRVSLRAPVRALGPGWRTLTGATFGEWQTQRLLARAGGTGAADAAAGWGGDRYTLLARGDERALVLRWVWDTPRDRAGFERALRAWGDGGLPGSEPAGRDVWRTPRGYAALATGGGSVTLVLAPGRALAVRAARAD
jgi:hypothetical protein